MSESSAPRWFPIALWALLVMVLLAVVVTALVSRLGRRTPPPPRLGEVPAFALLDQRGEPFGRGDLAGAPWVADFIFTRCTLSCPAMSARMAALDDRLPAEAALVSFTVDPEHDTPEVLAGYAERFGASPRWRFLTGGREEILRLALEGFRLAVDPEPPPGTVPPGEPIVHSTRFVLVDADGRIRGYYDGMDRQGVDDLERDLESLRRGG